MPSRGLVHPRTRAGGGARRLAVHAVDEPDGGRGRRERSDRSPPVVPSPSSSPAQKRAAGVEETGAALVERSGAEKGAGSNYLTIPLKPMKARARIPTLMMAMGTPLKALGTLFRARCSRMPAKMTMARP